MYLNLNSSVKWEIHAYQPQGAILLKTTSSEVCAKILVPIPEEPAFLEIGIRALLLEITQNVRIIRNLPSSRPFSHNHHKAYVCPSHSTS